MYPQAQPNYYIPQPQFMRPQYPQPLKGRPVSSLEEARAQSIDFDGSIFFFPNLGNNLIYTKQINPDGTASLNAYQLIELPQAQAPTQDYVTKEEFNAAIQDILNRIPSVKPEVPQAVAKF